jgi:hypothetical protein
MGYSMILMKVRVFVIDNGDIRCMSSNSKDAYKDLVRAVDNWHDEIFNYFDKRLTNAYTESINSIIRQVERMGRGYSFEALRAKILLMRTSIRNVSHDLIQVLSAKLYYTILSIGMK